MIADRQRPHRGLLGPVLLIGLGVVALLFTTGVVSPDVAGRLVMLWPVALVLLGVELVLVYGIPGRAGQVAAVVAMAAVVALAVGYALSVPAAPTSTFSASAPIAGIEVGSLSLNTGSGTVRISGASLAGDLYQARIQHGASAQPTADVNGGSVRLAVPAIPWAGSTEADVTLSQSVPWEVAINGAGLRGSADLGALHVGRFTLNGAGSRLDLTLPAVPTGPATVVANGAGLDLTVRVPRETAVHAMVAGLGNAIDVDGATVGGSSWATPGFDASAPHYEIQVAGVGTHVRLERTP